MIYKFTFYTLEIQNYNSLFKFHVFSDFNNNLNCYISVYPVPRGHSNRFYFITRCQEYYRKYSILLMLYDMHQNTRIRNIII